MKWNLSMIIVIILGAILVQSCDPPNRKTTGKLFNLKDKPYKLPNIEVYSLDNKRINIQDRTSNQHIKLVNFWATWCGPCNLEHNALKKVYTSWKKKYSFEIISISIDKQKMFNTLPAYIEHKQWPFVFYYDKNEVLSKSLNISNIPYSLLIDQKGNVVHIDQAYHEGFLEELEAMLKQLTINH